MALLLLHYPAGHAAPERHPSEPLATIRRANKLHCNCSRPMGKLPGGHHFEHFQLRRRGDLAGLSLLRYDVDNEHTLASLLGSLVPQGVTLDRLQARQPLSSIVCCCAGKCVRSCTRASTHLCTGLLTLTHCTTNLGRPCGSARGMSGTSQRPPACLPATLPPCRLAA